MHDALFYCTMISDANVFGLGCKTNIIFKYVGPEFPFTYLVLHGQHLYPYRISQSRITTLASFKLYYNILNLFLLFLGGVLVTLDLFVSENSENAYTNMPFSNNR